MDKQRLDPDKSIRELESIYKISELVDNREDDLEYILQGTAEILPDAYGGEKRVYVQIEMNGKIYGTEKHLAAPAARASHGNPAGASKDSSDSIVRPIRIERKQIGTLSVISRGTCSFNHGKTSSFKDEDMLLLQVVTERLGKICERIQVKRELQLKEEAYRQRNIALNELLDQHGKEKHRIAAQVQENIDKIVMPLIYDLEGQLSESVHSGTIRLLRQNLSEITAPFISNLSRNYSSLTLRELQICDMIRNNISSKEIGEILHIAPATVHHHRESIRRKLKLKGQKVNLAAWLQGHRLTGH